MATKDVGPHAHSILSQDIRSLRKKSGCGSIVETRSHVDNGINACATPHIGSAVGQDFGRVHSVGNVRVEMAVMAVEIMRCVTMLPAFLVAIFGMVTGR